MATTRVKDAGFLQLHIEKVLLGAGALILVIALVVFVLANPFKIEINGKSYPSPSTAIDELVRADRRLERGLLNENPLPEVVIPKFDNEIAAMIEKGIDVPQDLPAFASFGLTPSSIDPIRPIPSRYATVTPPTPTNIQSVIGTDVLDPELNRYAEDYFKLWGSNRTDFSMFIASGDFEISKWAERLKNAADEADGGKIPVGIWSQRFGISGVALLREELAEDGVTWINTKIVEALPGQARLLPSDKAPVDPVQAMQTINAYRSAPEVIARPELPWVTGLVQVVPPGDIEVGEGAEGFNEFGVKAELGPAEKQIKKLEEQIEQFQEAQRKRAERNRGNERTPRNSDLEPRPERSDPYARRIEGLQAKIEKLRDRAETERIAREQAEEERLAREAELREREAFRNRNQPGPFGVPLPGEFGEEQPGVQLEEDAKVRVYAADPTMRPGKTYRYKLLVAAINPLYAVPRLPPDQLKENQAKASLFPSQKDIDKMPWIEVSTEPTMIYYVSGTGSRAKVDVYRRIKGEMTKHSFDVSPGDVVGREVEIDENLIDMGTGLILVDIENRRSSIGRNDSKLIFIDQAGKLVERFSSIDSKSEKRASLEQEIKDGPAWKLRPKNEAEAFDDPGIGGFQEF